MEPAPTPFEQAETALQFIRRQSELVPRVGIVLGSGLGEFVTAVDEAVTIPYHTIPHFPRSTVEGHAGHLLLGKVAGVPVAVMAGRVHVYEGYSMPEVTFPARVLGLLGCHTLVLTNAAGGIRNYAPGSLVLIRDHINLTGTNAALGPNEPRFGTLPGGGLRFFDMTAAYAPRLRELAQEEAVRLGSPLEEGVYLAVLGPSYETPAEIRAFRTLGADLVGMSTVHETIVARHMGMDVLGISLVTNAAAGVVEQPIHHAEVMEIGRAATARLTALLLAVLPRIGNAVL